MENNNRREFLKKTILGASGFAVLPAMSNPKVVKTGYPVTAADLPVRVLGKTGISVPLISMGTSGTPGPEFVRYAYESGIRLFFSANYYGEGNNEKIVGQGLKDLPRGSYIIGTAATPEGLDRRTGLFTSSFRSDSYLKIAEESLKRFGMEQIEILLLPYAGKKEMVLHEGVLRTLEQLKKQGKIRFAGIASHSDTIEALDAAASSGVYDIAMISYNFRIQDIDKLDASVASAAKAGMGIVAMKTTAGAFWDNSGKKLNTNAAFKWVLQNENISSIISGMSTIDEMKKNLEMLKDIRMTETEKKDLLAAREGNENSLYCQQCRTCIPQCRNDLDIPTLMRTYMYAHGYGHTRRAKQTLLASLIQGKGCEDCDSCTVTCTSGFDVRKRISDISRLREIPDEFLA